MEKEAGVIHRETLSHLDESEGVGEEIDPDAELLEELLRKEEEEVLALLAAREEYEELITDTDMEDVVMSDIEVEGV